MQLIAEIGAARGIDGGELEQFLESAAADVFQIHAIGPPGGCFVEIDRNAELTPDPLPGGDSQRNAFLQAHPPHRDERHDVGRSDPRMDAGLLRHVDAERSLGDGADGRLSDEFRRAGEGDHGAVMVRVERHVEDLHLPDRRDRVGDRLHFARLPAFGKIGHALDDGARCHGVSIVL